MNEIKISCIVPVYKVPEEYLRKCINSLINQTLKEIEIILVDDGSPDKCPDICDEYSKLDNRIKVIHQENKGLAGARNTGTKLSKGQYITYIDADDYLELDGLNKLYSYSLNNYDVIRGGVYKVFSNKKELLSFNSIALNKPYINNDIIILKEKVLDFNANISSACGALYKRNFIINNNLFNNESLKQGCEDIEFSFRVYDYAKSAIIINIYFYNYIWNESSISAFNSDENNYRVLNGFMKIKENITQQNDKNRINELYNLFYIRVLYSIVSAAISGYFHPLNKSNYFMKKKQMNKYLKNELVKESLKFEYIKKLDFKRIIIILLIKMRFYSIILFLGKYRYREKRKN